MTKTAKQNLERKQTQVRMDAAFKARIRKYIAHVLKEQGLEVNFSAAVRALIEKGLEAAQL